MEESLGGLRQPGVCMWMGRSLYQYYNDVSHLQDNISTSEFKCSWDNGLYRLMYYCPISRCSMG